MTLELVNTLATCATFAVIAATAITAIVQLRHVRASNQIAAFNDLRQTYESSHLAAAHKYVDTYLHRDLEDPAFRYAIAHRSGRTEESHALVKHRQDPASWENFEYVAVLAARWRQKHPTGSYPKNMPRLPLEYRWAEADREYEASLKANDA